MAQRLQKGAKETFQAPAFHLCLSAVLTLYAAQHVTGLVVDSGLDATRLLPICCSTPIFKPI